MATCSAVAGTPARRHSTTGLRPSTVSGVVAVGRPAPVPAAAPDRPAAPRLRGPRGRPARRRMAGAHLRGRGRALALQRATALAAGADDHALLGAFLAHRAAALGVAGHGSYYTVLQRPGGAVRLVLDGHPGGGEPVAHRVGGGEVAPGARLLALREQVVDQRGERSGRGVGRRRRRSAHCGSSGSSPSTPVIARTDAAAARSAAARSPASSAVLPSRTVSWIAASAPGVPRSSSIAAVNSGAQRAGLRRADPLPHAVHERLDAPVGGHRLLQRGVGVLDGRAVVRADQVVAQLDPAHPAQQRVDRQRVAQRLRHLLAAHGDPGVVQPEPGEPVARRRGTGRARSRGAGTPGRARRRGCRTPGPGSTVAIAEHSRCQPGRPRPHGVGQDGSPGLAAFHSVKSQRVALGAALALALRDVVDPLAGQRAVVREGPHREVDVAAGRVGVPALDQPLHQLDHLRHVAGGPRLDRRRQAAQRVVGGREGALVGGRPLPPRTAGRRRPCVRILSSMSVTLRTSATSRPPVGEPAAQHVVVEPGPDVPDVRQALHGGATDVDRRSPGPQRDEVPLLSGGGVEEAQAHLVQGTDRCSLRSSAAVPIRPRPRRSADGRLAP